MEQLDNRKRLCKIHRHLKEIIWKIRITGKNILKLKTAGISYMEHKDSLKTVYNAHRYYKDYMAHKNNRKRL